MILHKYYDNYGLDTLKNLELKANVPSGFNDPFEFLPKNVGKWTLAKSKRYLKNKNFTGETFQEFKRLGIVRNKKEFKALLKNDGDTFAKLISSRLSEEYLWDMIIKMRKKTDEITRIICFSSEEANELEQILLWSHYTDGHCGMRFHFDSEFLVESNDKLEKIDYDIIRPEFDSTIDPTSTKFQSLLVKSFRTKSRVWEYEKEYRLFLFPTKCIPKDIRNKTMYFVKYNSKSLVRIDLGVNCSSQMRNDIFAEIKKSGKSHIKLYRAKINRVEYKLDYIAIN